MSIDNLKKFSKLCAEDEDVRARAKEIGINNPEKLIAYAGKELGLDFNHDDMTALANESGTSLDELSEEDLEKVAGGKWTIPQDDE
jgi:predicted ribosomally synthesized peptide with nif11-like leader